MTNKPDFVDLAKVDGTSGREDYQRPWYPWIEPWVRELTVLDVGAGVSRSKEWACPNGAASVTTQDPCAWCGCDLSVDVHELVDKGMRWDAVTCLDVIEHVVDYGRFARALMRLANRRVLVTTPNVLVSQNLREYHYHEFMPDELVQLFEAAGGLLLAVRWLENGGWRDLEGVAARDWARGNPALHPVGFVFSVWL